MHGEVLTTRNNTNVQMYITHLLVFTEVRSKVAREIQIKL